METPRIAGADGCRSGWVVVRRTDSGPIQADRMARRFLGWPRMTSIFSAPIRPVLEAKNYSDATRIRRNMENKGMSRQAWGITTKIREVDIAIREFDPGQSRVREGHPEVSFKAWAGHPMQNAKK